MSLVNDMLRDLDSRRRESAGPSASREKLIPATERKSRTSKTASAGKWIAPLLIVAIAVGGVLLWRSQLALQIPVLSVPVVAPVAAAQAPALEPRVDQAILEEMERMSLRMQELEQRNVTLQLQVEQTIPAPDIYESPQMIQADAIALEPEEGLPERNAELVVQEAGLPPLLSATPDAATLVRMPAQMNFREVDRRRVQDALTLWQQGQHGAALDGLRAFTATNPQAHQAREMLAKLLLQRGEMIAAMEQADLGLGIQPDNYGYKKVKARVLMAAGVPAEAADLLALRAPSLAGDSEYHELLAASRLASQKYDEALVSYQALSASAPLESRWSYGVAASLDALGRSFEAVQSYERALQLGGLTPALRQNSQQRIASIRQN